MCGLMRGSYNVHDGGMLNRGSWELFSIKVIYALCVKKEEDNLLLNSNGRGKYKMHGVHL